MAKKENGIGAAEIAARIEKVVDKYAGHWDRSAKPEFRRAAKLIRRRADRLKILGENVPEEFAGSWKWVVDARDIEIVHRVLAEAKEADDAEESN